MLHKIILFQGIFLNNSKTEVSGEPTQIFNIEKPLSKLKLRGNCS
jgi:hypothetical protein